MWGGGWWRGLGITVWDKRTSADEGREAMGYTAAAPKTRLDALDLASDRHLALQLGLRRSCISVVRGKAKPHKQRLTLFFAKASARQEVRFGQA